MYVTIKQLQMLYCISIPIIYRVLRFHQIDLIQDELAGKNKTGINPLSCNLDYAMAALDEYVAAKKLISGINSGLTYSSNNYYKDDGRDFHEMSPRNFAERGLKVDIELSRRFLRH